MSNPHTPAGQALVEWAENAHPNQIEIWRDHALLIEAQARRATVEPLLPGLKAIRDTSTDPASRNLAASLLAILDAEAER